MCCCCCEIQKEENLTTKKQYRHGAEHKSCCQEVNPVSRSLRQLKAELIRHDIEVEELNIKTLEFQNKELEEKFMSQWRIHKEWSVILFGTVCIIVFVIKLWFFARKEFFKAWVVPIGLVPSVMLVVLAITKPDFGQPAAAWKPLRRSRCTKIMSPKLNSSRLWQSWHSLQRPMQQE